MPLATPALQSSLGSVFGAGYTTADAAASAWADAYDTYAQTGTCNGIVPTVAPSAKTVLRAALAAQFGVSSSAADAAVAIGAALVVYWAAGVTFAGATAPPIAVVGLAAIVASLTGIFGVVTGTAVGVGNSMGTAIAVFTAAVTCAFPGPLVANVL